LGVTSLFGKIHNWREHVAESHSKHDSGDNRRRRECETACSGSGHGANLQQQKLATTKIPSSVRIINVLCERHVTYVGTNK